MINYNCNWALYSCFLHNPLSVYLFSHVFSSSRLPLRRHPFFSSCWRKSSSKTWREHRWQLLAWWHSQKIIYIFYHILSPQKYNVFPYSFFLICWCKAKKIEPAWACDKNCKMAWYNACEVPSLSKKCRESTCFFSQSNFSNNRKMKRWYGCFCSWSDQKKGLLYDLHNKYLCALHTECNHYHHHQEKQEHFLFYYCILIMNNPVEMSWKGVGIASTCEHVQEE